MAMKQSKYTLFMVHAHPDDESIGTGGTIAKYAARGVRTVVVFCTRGEEGDIQNPEFVMPRPGMSMEAIRAVELDNALSVLGVDERFFLGYRDSGMMGTPPNENTESFFKADFDEAVARLLHIIQDVHPQVLVTYNERGGYGHPDHIMANKITTAAFHKASHGDRRPSPQKLYYLGTPLSLMRQRHQLALERGQKPRMNPELLGTPDALITTAIDVESYIPKKFAALACHKSQMGPNSFFRQVSEDRIKEYFKYEYYVCVEGCEGKKQRETDFFEGIYLE